MKITLENIGVFKYAEYSLADLTIICGKNNTGKTYATYALFGFIDFFRNGYFIKVDKSDIEKLISTGSLSISLDVTQRQIDKYLNDACKTYVKFIPKIFSAQLKNFKDAKFNISVSIDELKIQDEFEATYKSSNKDVIQIKKEGNLLLYTLLSSNEDLDERFYRIILPKIVGDTLKDVLFDKIFPNTFIASAERTGAVIFKDELNFQKTALLKVVTSDEDIDLDNITDKIYNTQYALPVRRNIDFIRKLDIIARDESILSNLNVEIIQSFNNIVGGEYRVSKNNVTYSPNKSSSIRLSMGESASAVRSLMDIYFYLKHVAKPGEMLMIDEPELNLHPESQRRFAILIAKLINSGLKVFITTHSDYIIKEINSLLMFNYRSSESGIRAIMSKYGYIESDLIDPDQVAVYISKKHPVRLKDNIKRTSIQTLIKAKIDPQFGIEAESFDDTINLMNQIQQSIIFSSDE